jgi:hypothetical protein
MENTSVSRWIEPKEVSDIFMAFPAKVIDQYLPLVQEIPEEFWAPQNLYNRMVTDVFFQGTKEDWEFALREGIEIKTFKRHVMTCLRSFEPPHEHKIAGVAYLISLWCPIISSKG